MESTDWGWSSPATIGLLAGSVVRVAAQDQSSSYFTGTIDDLFSRHGGDLNPWFRRIALAAMVLFVLSVLRRLYYKVRELVGIRREMRELRAEIDSQAEE